MKIQSHLLSLGFALVSSALFITSAQANWPAWRGPLGSGVVPEKNAPLKWSPTENVRWKTPLPDRGNSTPAIWGDKVFVTQAIEKDGLRTLIVSHGLMEIALAEVGDLYAEGRITRDQFRIARRRRSSMASA